MEFALLLPVFMAMVLGMFSGGLAFNQRLDLVHTAREGARYGATVPEAATFPPGQTWATTVRSVTVSRSSGEATTANTCVSLVSGSPPTVVTPSSSFSTATGGARCFADTSDTTKRVQVSITKPFKIQFLFGTYSSTMTVRATARFEQ